MQSNDDVSRKTGRAIKKRANVSLSLFLSTHPSTTLLFFFFLFALFITIDNAIASTSASRDKNFSTLVSVHVTDIH